jgi:hypothetical protein
MSGLQRREAAGALERCPESITQAAMSRRSWMGMVARDIQPTVTVCLPPTIEMVTQQTHRRI